MSYNPDQRRAALRDFMRRRELKPKAWCRSAGLAEGTLPAFLAGRSRSLSDETYELLADAAEVDAAELRGAYAPSTLEIFGKVGAGAEVFPFDDVGQGGGIDDVQAPPGVGPGASAVIVTGDSMFPVYRAGDILVYRRADGADWSRHIGREVVTELRDGRAFVKLLKRVTKTTATLGSWNAPDIENARVRWAAPVLWVKRAG